jgi:uncharacterized protein involved in response to NO
MNFIQQHFKHPLWLIGFRPLFTLGFISGAVLPILWYLVHAGKLQFDPSIPAVTWHAHEMYFGFGWAVLSGFLLTASKNWSGVRGHHGAVLALAGLFWLLDRLAFWLPAGMPLLADVLLHNAFLLLLVPLIVGTLLQGLGKISQDNWYFILGLPLFIVSKNLLLYGEQHFELAWTMTQGLFRLAVAAFMQATYQINVPRSRWLDAAIRFGIFIAVFEALLPTTLAVSVLAVTATLMLYRFAQWHPKAGFRTMDTGVSFAAYLALVAALYLECLRISGQLHVVGDVATHAFTMLSMGLLMAAMMIRISQGHTARPIVFAGSDKVGLWALILGGLVRVLLPQIWPQSYSAIILFAALCWGLAFALLGWRLIPFLLRPRLDGKES